jgi:hypothetical protein
LSSYRCNVARHSRRFVIAQASSQIRERDGGIGLAAIEVLNTWTNFVRAYWLSSFDAPQRSEGGRISCARPVVGSDPLGFAVTTFRPAARPKGSGNWDRRDEPTWHDPQTLLRLTREAELSNTADVAAAFSINSRVFTDLPVLRNYFAHRSQGTYYAALRVALLNSVPLPTRPAEVLAAVPALGSQTLFENWLGDFDLVAEYLCA